MTWQERIRDYGSDACSICGETYTKDRPVCCSECCNEDFTLHIDGMCVVCCKHEPGPPPKGYERMDCNQ